MTPATLRAGPLATLLLTAATGRTTTLTWAVDDAAGNAHIVTDPDAVRAALR